MVDFLANYMLPLALLAVLVALGLGIYTLFRGGETARSYSNKLMRWRVGLQFLAIVLLALVVFLRGEMVF